MNRKHFFSKLLLGSIGALFIKPTVNANDRPTQRINLASEYIAGFSYYDGPEIENLLSVNMMLNLNREPHNRYDKNAIEVFCGDAKLGYIPRNANVTIARLMDQGVEIEAQIVGLNPNAYPFGNVKTELWYNSNI